MYDRCITHISAAVGWTIASMHLVAEERVVGRRIKRMVVSQ